MATIVFFLSIWLACKGIKSACNPHTKPVYKPIQDKRKIDYMASLLALQQARETQEILIRYIDESITTAATAQETISLMNKKATAIEKLARIEKQITKLIS